MRKTLLILLLLVSLSVVSVSGEHAGSYINQELFGTLYTDTGAGCFPAGSSCDSSLTIFYPVDPSYFVDHTLWEVKTYYGGRRNISLNRSHLANNTGFYIRYNATHTTTSSGVSLFEYYNGSSWVQLENETNSGTASTNTASQLWTDQDFSTGSAWFQGAWRADSSTHPVSRVLTFYEQQMWWLKGSTLNVTLTIRDEFNNLVNLALVNVTRVDENFSLGAKYTDISGSVLFEMLHDTQYVISVSADGYDDFTGFITVIQDSYSIVLTSNTSTPMYSLYKYLSFVTSPGSSPLTPIDNQSFEVQANISNGSLDYFGVTTTFNGSTTTDNDTTAVGGIANITINTTGHSGKTINVSYFFKINGSQQILFVIPYYIQELNQTNNTLFNISQDFDAQLSLKEKVGLMSILLIILIILLSVSGVPAEWSALVSNILVWTIAMAISWVPIIISSIVIMLSFGFMIMIARQQIG